MRVLQGPSKRSAWRSALLAALAACGGSYRPAHFSAAPPVTDVGDDAPTPVPAKRAPFAPELLSEAYVERPILDAMERKRKPDAGDVNALDEVPRSSWFGREPMPIDTSPPVMPLTPLPEAPLLADDGLVVQDARGLRYELHRDRPDRPRMRTAAEVIASHLLGAFGYLVPAAWVLQLHRTDLVSSGGTLEAGSGTPQADAGTSQADAGAPQVDSGTSRAEAFLRAGGPSSEPRVSATRWPIGVDLGPSPARGKRGDDANDLVEHVDRRTLRVLPLALFWIGDNRLSRESLRDAYFGVPGQGYVRHYIVGIDGALGADAIPTTKSPNTEYQAPSLGHAFVTLGLSARRPVPTQTRWLSLGYVDEEASASDCETSPPFDPRDHLLPSDAYWAAKRVAHVNAASRNDALSAARFDDESARARAAELLAIRRANVVAYGFGAVTPCEVSRFQKGTLSLRDLAIVEGIALAKTTKYAIAFTNGDGARVAPSMTVPSTGVETAVRLPEVTVPYLIVWVSSERDGRSAPRPLEVHLIREEAGFRVAAVRH